MIFNRGSVFIFSYFLITSLNAGEIGAKLTSQIELLPSCSINNKIVENNTANLNFGSVDFGEATTAFNGVLEASLINNGDSGLQIQCAGISTVKVIFGSGNNDSKVPVLFSQNYYHALSNGKDFIAYNLLYGLNKQVIRANDVFILNDMNTKKNIDIFGQAVHDGSGISKGEYKDIVPITIEF
ncbi:spore coat protein U domain-containing protein [Acinetobacter nosocomialis]|uniref:spore coat protein U domain-containing protein n=1 Tax=Acinetobacter nosocomialis TaxID=106654 RepID=UPI00124FCFDD|nr:spore coat protein U domain-containing protein [Acinetobacter nosocomialis]MDB9694623.1 spore coat U domain-containing protein [Acinetobacter nosocomialis]MDP7776415.1 spore coat protein U domain-containing protein [Acinetobacter nosocomialis]